MVLTVTISLAGAISGSLSPLTLNSHAGNVVRMETREIQDGSTITNGECAVRVTEPSHGYEPGWLGLYISLAGGSMTGTPCIIPEADLAHYRHVPFEWRELEAAGIEERYVWRQDCRALVHEIRPLDS